MLKTVPERALWHSLDAAAAWLAHSDVEQEVEHVAVLDHVLFSLGAHLARLLGAVFALVGDVVIEGDGLGADEAALEAEIAELSDEDKQVFLADLNLEEPGLNRLVRAGYDLLGLQTYFTAGVKEVRAWTIHKGDTAPQAAGVIHTDFEKGFIRAEVISYDDFVTYNGEQGAKEAGKMRLEGKEYVVKDGDVMHFRFNV